MHPGALADPAWAKAHPADGEFVDSGLSRFARRFASPTAAVDATKEVADTITLNDVVVVGMKGNPFVKQARTTLDQAGITYKYCEYGGYFSEYAARFAIKRWSGWPTIPQVFVKGQLIGGADHTKAMVVSGELAGLLSGAPMKCCT